MAAQDTITQHPPRALINAPQDVVADALDGLASAYPKLLEVHRDPDFVLRAPAHRRDKVALLSGGGSGHEPLHAGFVGPGMLDAAVPGAVFASPTAAQVAAATEAVDRGRGVLHIVKGYTGDILNFSIAAELTADAGIALETVVVDDDLATDRTGDDQDDGGLGRRGTAAVVAVEKLCGAAAERGASLAEVAALGRRVVAGSRTLAVALSGCTHPGHDAPSFTLPAGEVELGVGIHGERGHGRVPLRPAAELIRTLAEPVIAALGLRPGDRTITIVNGLGATHQLELLIVQRELRALLDAAGIEQSRTLVGSYVTALDMAGASITLVRADDELLDLWDAPVRTSGLTW